MRIIVEKYQKLNKYIKCIIWLLLLLFIETKMMPFLVSKGYLLFEKQMISIYENASPTLEFNVYIWLSYACSIPIIVLLFFLLAKFEKTVLCEYFPRSIKLNLKLLSLGFIIGMMEVSIPIIFAISSGSIEITTFNFNYIPFVGLFFFLIIAFYEEVCFRLCVYGVLRKNTNSTLAIVFSIIFFVLSHLGNFIAVGVTVLDIVSLATGAIAYCIILEKSKSILFVTGIHLGWNILQLYIFDARCSGIRTNAALFKTNVIKSSFFFDADWGIEGTWIAPIMDMILCIVVFIYYQKKPVKKVYK